MTVGIAGPGGDDLSVADRERQVASLRQSLGDRHPSTLAALRALTEAHRAAGDFAGALVAAEELLAASRQTSGPHHRDSLSLAALVANFRRNTGDSATAATELEQLIPLLEEHLGGDHVDTVLARHTMASCLGQDADPLAALTTWIGLFADEQRVLGAEHAHTLTARHNFAFWRRQLGDSVGAVDEISRVVAIRRRSLGEDHPDTLSSRLALETWRGEAGDTGGAVAEVVALLPLLRNVFGYDHEQTLSARHVCALWGQDTGKRPIDAVADWTVLVDDEKRVLGADHPLTDAGRATLAARRAEWEAWLDDCQELARDICQDMEIQESGSDELTLEIATLAAEQAADYRERAIALMDRVIAAKKQIARCERDFGEDSEQALRARYHLAYALWEGQEYDAATDHSEHLVDDCVRVLGEQHEFTVSVRHLLAAGKRYESRFQAQPAQTEEANRQSDNELDEAYPGMTVAEMNDIRRYAVEALAQDGIDVVVNADGTALQRSDGYSYGLDNLVASCRNNPAEEWRGVVTKHFTQLAAATKSLAAADEMDWPELARRVRSRVVSSAQVEETSGMLSYAWPLAEGLYEVLCIDFPDVVKFMNSSQVAAYDVQRLRETARRNTIGEPIEGVEVQEAAGAEVHVLHGASSFVASKVLDIEALVPTYLRDTSHGVVVGVPSRNFLVLHQVETAGKLFAAINAMSGICPGLSQRYPGPVTADMYFWKNGKMQCISRVEAGTGNICVDVSGELAATLGELAE